MPITSELDNRRKFKAAGFTDEQSEVLVEVIERSQQQGFERFVEVLERQLKELRTEIKADLASLRAEIGGVRAETKADLANLRAEIGELRGEIGELRGEMGELRGEFQSALRDQLFKLVALIISVVGLGVAIIKLFPDWY